MKTLSPVWPAWPIQFHGTMPVAPYKLARGLQQNRQSLESNIGSREEWSKPAVRKGIPDRTRPVAASPEEEQRFQNQRLSFFPCICVAITNRHPNNRLIPVPPRTSMLETYCKNVSLPLFLFLCFFLFFLSLLPVTFFITFMINL